MRYSRYKMSHVHDFWRDYNSRGQWTTAKTELRCVLKLVSIPSCYFLPRFYFYHDNHQTNIIFILSECRFRIWGTIFRIRFFNWMNNVNQYIYCRIYKDNKSQKSGLKDTQPKGRYVCDSLQQKVPKVGLYLCLIHKHYKSINYQHLKRIINLHISCFCPLLS